jgi:biotin operon repressor
MKPEKLDMLLAFKAIALTDALSGAEKRVAGAILDSFNQKTAQCDPSLNRIAHQLRMSRRTVIRAIISIEREGFMGKRRHGGYSHRNSYAPNWLLYRRIEAEWATRKKTSHWKPVMSDTSPCQSLGCHTAGDAAGTQTCLINQSNKPVMHGANFDGGRGDENSKLSEQAKHQEAVVVEGGDRLPRRAVRPHDAAVTAAERRWNAALYSAFAKSPEVCAKIIGAIDSAMQNAATHAELRKRGTGFRYILERLRALNLETPLEST